MKPTYEELEQQLAESHRALRAETTAHDHVKMHLEKMAAENVGLKEYLAPVGLAVEGTPATDAFLAEVRAQCLNAFIQHHSAELEARAFNPAILDVIAERQRQQSVEGWMPEHDDEHCNGELAMAAVCYINETGTVNRNGGKPWGWPWDASWWKPNARRRNLVKAGALILAEIERIDRAAGIGKGE